MKFAHMGDCHLGGWREPELRDLNFKSFQFAVEKCIKEKVEFILITGDLFDSAYPSIDILKEAFKEFRKIKEANIPVFIIAGSHDYSISGKTFLDVLEKAGFCENASKFEERNNNIFLQPTIYKNFAIYGYPGKRSSLEVEDIKRIKLQDSPGLFKILMLHTAIKDAIGNLPIKSVDEKSLPKVDYLALSHLHINYNKEGRVYSGPIFPNELNELEELKHGSFYIINDGKISKQIIKLKEVLSINFEIKESKKSTDEIISLLMQNKIEDKIIILKLSGFIEDGGIGEIDFKKIEDFLKQNGAYLFLKSTSNLYSAEQEFNFGISSNEDIEEKIIENFFENNPDKLNNLSKELIKVLQIEKMDDEAGMIFQDRLISEARKVLGL